MTKLEIILICLLWIITGSFIGYKRNWYKKHDEGNAFTYSLFGVIYAPISLLISFIRVYLIDDWKND